MSDTNSTKLRLWVLSWGLFPRRVTIYLKEKGITDDFEIIPVDITMNGMETSPGKPAGTMPILEVRRPSSPDATDGEYIYQSTAILEYLEDVYTTLPSMRGETASQRAHIRDCISILNDANEAFGMYAHNASILFSTMEPQSLETARSSQERMHRHFSSLDALAQSEGPWLIGSQEGPSIADCMAMATVQFAWEIYGYDLTEKHPSLKRMYETFAQRESAEMEEAPTVIKEMAPQMSVR